MNVTLEQLRDIKHRLPHGSITRIAQQLQVDEQLVRNFFGANVGGVHPDTWHHEPGPQGGIVHFDDTRIYEAAMQILNESLTHTS
jgi:hypothetical protein